MCDSDSSSSVSDHAPSCSTHYEDLDPDVRDKFGRLATVLRETNQNLVTFEFLLSHYRSLARVAPLPASPLATSVVTPINGVTERMESSRVAVLESRVDSEEILDLLRSISQSVDGFREQLKVAATHRDLNIVEEGDTVEQNDGDVDDLEQTATVRDVAMLDQGRRLIEKDKEITELKTALMKVEKELLEERQVAEIRAELMKQLEKKLDNERLAAKEMSKEIKYYVEKLSKLEARKDNLKNLSLNSVKSVDLNTVDQCVGTENGGLLNFDNLSMNSVESVDRCVSTEVGEQEHLHVNFVERVDQCVGTAMGGLVSSCSSDFDRKDVQRLELKLLEEKGTYQLLLAQKGELEERLKDTERDVAAMEESRVRLKNKTRTLLKQYRAKRGSVEKKELQLAKLRQGLLHLRSLCENVECNYQAILHHLGAQIHVAARLLSLHCHQTNPVIPPDLPVKSGQLGAWFQDVQSMASWLQRSVAMLAVGQERTSNLPEFDMSRSTVYRRVRGEQDTQSEMSNGMLDEEAAFEAVRVCEAGLNEQNTTVNSLIGCIDVT